MCVMLKATDEPWTHPLKHHFQHHVTTYSGEKGSERMVFCVNGVLHGWIHIGEIFNLWLRAQSPKTTGHLILILELRPSPWCNTECLARASIVLWHAEHNPPCLAYSPSTIDTTERQEVSDMWVYSATGLR